MTALRVTTEEYAAAAEPVDSASIDVDHTMTTLMGKLAQGANVGTDAISAPLARAVDAAARSSVASGCELTGRFSALAGAIRQSAHHHALADSQAALTPLGAPPSPQHSSRSTSAKAPPSALAAGGTDPTGWENVAPYVQRDWPNGLTGHMHSAADAYKSAASSLHDISKATRETADQLAEQSSPEIETAQAKAKTMGQDASTAADGLQRVGTALEIYASYLDENRTNVETFLRNAVTTLHQSQSSGDAYSASASAGSGAPTPEQVEQYWRQAAQQVDTITAAVQREANQLAGDLAGTDGTKLQSQIADMNASTKSMTHHPIGKVPGQEGLDQLVKVDTTITGLMDQASYASSLKGNGIRGYVTGFANKANVEAWGSSVESALRGSSKTLGFAEKTGVMSRALDFRALGAAGSEASTVGKFVSKAGPLGAVGVVSGGVSVVNDLRAGEKGKAVEDSISTGLAAGAILAPPPADIVCGAAALVDSAYHIPWVHDHVNSAVSAAAHGTVSTLKSAGSTIKSGWESLTDGW